MTNIPKQYYYIHDCETSGLTKKHSILTYYGCLLDENLNLIKETPEYKVKPDHSNSILIEPRAMEINKINLVEHFKDPNTITYDMLIHELADFLNSIDMIAGFKYGEIFLDMKSDIWKKNTSNEINITFGGNNCFFDNGFIWEDLKKHLDPNIKIRDTHLLDSASIGQFLKFCGKFPKDLKLSLENLGKYFELNIEGLHSAKRDVLLTIEVLKKMREMIK